MPIKTDYSNWDKEELIEHIRQLEKRRKYGLVWDEERTYEDFDEKSQNCLPVLVDVPENTINTDPQKPTHILIEGDNFHALSVLNYTHERLVDLIYIDPPYNTGKSKKEFRFNDRYIEKEDAFRHSKWLSFMKKRLRLAKPLLKEGGIIIISIDDNEVAQLRLLCDEIFDEKNFIALLPTIINLKGNNDQFGFAGTHEYNIIYAADKEIAKIGEFTLIAEDLDEWEEDEIGLFKKGANLKATGINAPREKRPNLFYAIFVTPEGDYYVTDDDKLPSHRKGKGDTKVLPLTDDREMSWRWEKNKVKNEPFNIIITKFSGEFSIYKKQRPNLGDIPTKKPKTIFYKPEYSSGNGTQLLKSMFGEKIFDNPKPLALIRDLFFLTTKPNSIILDFFAGSGTTAHAAMELNNNDGGYRQVILCTDNENNICSEVCYPRIEKVINGYINSKKLTIEGLGGNLKYYRTSFVPANPTDENKEKLTMQSVEMLCLRENTFDFVAETDIWSIYENQTQYTGILFDQLSIPQFKIALAELKEKPITVYVFSLGEDNFTSEFADLGERINARSIPEAILRAYKRIYR